MKNESNNTRSQERGNNMFWYINIGPAVISPDAVTLKRRDDQ